MIEDYKYLIKFDQDLDCVLVVKKWYKIVQEREYRCFVYDNKLKGVCQRYLHFIHPQN